MQIFALQMRLPEMRKQLKQMQVTIDQIQATQRSSSVMSTGDAA
jgi:flagellar hook-length control protein FliK